MTWATVAFALRFVEVVYCSFTCLECDFLTVHLAMVHKIYYRTHSIHQLSVPSNKIIDSFELQKVISTRQQQPVTDYLFKPIFTTRAAILFGSVNWFLFSQTRVLIPPRKVSDCHFKHSFIRVFKLGSGILLVTKQVHDLSCFL